MDSESGMNAQQIDEPVISSGEINSWRRGFTPQAEIWNGRMAMFGLAVGLASLFCVRFVLIN